MMDMRGCSVRARPWMILACHGEAFLQPNAKGATLYRLRPAVSGASATLPIQALK